MGDFKREMDDSDREAFRTWLSSRSCGGVVGYVGLADQCPLAWWNRERTGCGGMVLFVSYEVNCISYSLPVWASQFVCGIDELSCAGEAVTREQALAVLDSIGGA